MMGESAANCRSATHMVPFLAGELLHTLTGHTGIVLAVAMSADGSLLATGSSDMTVRLWNPKSGVSGHSLGPILTICKR